MTKIIAFIRGSRSTWMNSLHSIRSDAFPHDRHPILFLNLRSASRKTISAKTPVRNTSVSQHAGGHALQIDALQQRDEVARRHHVASPTWIGWGMFRMA